MPKPSISVVIPVYNRLELLRHAVDSVLAQTYPPHEIIIVDDASEIPTTLDSIGIFDERIKILHHSQRVGAAAARQTGVDQAAGDLIAFLDSDDCWFEDKLETQVQTLLEAPPESEMVSVVCGWQYDNDDRFPHAARMPVASSDIVDFAGGCWFCPGSTLLISRKVFQSVGPFDTRLERLEDFEWFLRFAMAGGSLLCAPVIGAAIRKGRRAKMLTVNTAVESILSKYASERSSAFPPKARRHLLAWLHTEQAVAARNENRLLVMAYHLALSLILVPRITVMIKPLWEIVKARPAPWPQDHDPRHLKIEPHFKSDLTNVQKASKGIPIRSR